MLVIANKRHETRKISLTYIPNGMYVDCVMNEAKHSAAETRRKLLDVAAAEVLENGFRATSLDNILVKAGVTKGALYYHFKNKKELGLAMIDELYRSHATGRWVSGLNRSDDPVQDLIDVLKAQRTSACASSVRCGCPVNNLAQEMASVDEDFRLRIEEIFKEWRSAISASLERGKANGFVKPNVDTRKAAIFITSLVEGAVGASKTARDPAILHSALETLELFIETLRPGRFIRATASAAT